MKCDPKDSLLPCPFCGGEAEYHGECDMVAIRCSTCGAGTSGWWDEPEEAAEEWNHRPDKWIPVTERLPEEGETILAWHKDGFIMLLVNMFDEMEDVTHWRPLPAGPESNSGFTPEDDKPIDYWPVEE